MKIMKNFSKYKRNFYGIGNPPVGSPRSFDTIVLVSELPYHICWLTPYVGGYCCNKSSYCAQNQKICNYECNCNILPRYNFTKEIL